MKRPAAVFTIALALGAIVLAPRGGAQAQDRQGEGSIEIDKCQTISQLGSYKLVNNLTFKGPAGGTCLSITASFVTIDLAGFTITTTGMINNPNLIKTTAIGSADNTTGTTVRNGSILGTGGFTAGVSLGGNGSIVEGLRVSDMSPGGVGISAAGIVRGNTAVGIFGPGPGNGTGISATGLITGNYVSGNRGVGIFAGQGSTVLGNTATNSIDVGIVVNCPSNVTDNTATGRPAGNLVLNGTGCNNTNNVAP
jgi:hypothetical protein